MTPPENLQALRHCPAPTRPWALQAMYVVPQCWELPIMNNAPSRHPGSIPAENPAPDSKQYIWSWRGYAWGLSKFKPQLWVASR